MTEPPFVLVDSNVIIDIIRKDPEWVEWSLNALSQYEKVSVNPIIYTELCYQKTSVEEADQLLEALSLGYDELPREALFLASQAFREYRIRGGKKTAPLADFFIGAHAAALDVPILTRDVDRYRSYFPTVSLICPGKTQETQGHP